MYSSVAELLASCDVDAVLIATPHHVLAPTALSAMRAGKHVLVEKPAALRSSELEPLVRLAQERGLVYQAGFNYRFHPAMERAKALLREGAMGRLLHGSARHGHGGRLRPAGYPLSSGELARHRFLICSERPGCNGS